MCAKMKNNKWVARSFIATSMLWSLNAYALEALSEQEMGAIQGRDGVTIGLQVPQSGAITAEQIRWELDNGETDANSASLQNHIIIGGTAIDSSQFAIKPIDLDGSEASQALDFALAIDAYTNDQGRPGPLIWCRGAGFRWALCRLRRWRFCQYQHRSGPGHR